MFKVDLAKFKKVSTDKDHTVMSDENGHEIKILHKALSTKMRKQLEALPHDGESELTKTSKESVGRGVKDSAEDKVVDRGSFKKFADGGQVANLKESYKKDAKDFKKGFEHPTTLAEGFQNLRKAVGYAEGGEAVQELDRAPSGVSDMPDSQDAAMSMADAGLTSPMETAAPQVLAPQATMSAGVQPAMPQSAVAAGAPIPGAQLQPMQAQGQPEESPSAMDGYDKQVKGMKQEADAISQQAKTDETNLKAHIVATQKIEQDYNDHVASLDEERKAHIDDINNNQIDPAKYWDTHSKIGTAIGFILAGFNPAGKPNAAIDFFHKQMDENLKAQERNLGTKENLLSANLKQFGNLRDAKEMTRVMQNDVIVNQLKQAAAKASGPVAQARLLQEAGKLELNIAPTVQNLAIKRTLDSGAISGQDPAMYVPHIVPKEHQAKVFGEIEAAQNTKNMSGAIMKAFDESVKETSGAGAISSLVKNPRSSQALHQAMQPTFKDLEGTVRQAAMDNTFKNVTPNSFDTKEDLKIKRDALTDYLQSKSSAPTAKSYGIDLSKFDSTKPMESGPQIKILDGKKYEKTTRNGVVGWIPVTSRKK